MSKDEADRLKNQFRFHIELIRNGNAWSFDEIAEILGISGQAYINWVKPNKDGQTFLPRNHSILRNLLKKKVALEDVSYLQNIVISYRNLGKGLDDLEVPERYLRLAEQGHAKSDGDSGITIDHIYDELNVSISLLEMTNWGSFSAKALRDTVELVREISPDNGARFVKRLKYLSSALESVMDFCRERTDISFPISEIRAQLHALGARFDARSPDIRYIYNDPTDEPTEFEETRKICETIDGVLSGISGHTNDLIDNLRVLRTLLSSPRISPSVFQETQSELEDLTLRLDVRGALEGIRCDLCILISRHLDKASDLTIFRERLPTGDAGPEMVIIPACENGYLRKVEHKNEYELLPIPGRFAIGRYPVTWQQYFSSCEYSGAKKIEEYWIKLNRMKNGESSIPVDEPVTGISLEEASEFISWINENLNSYRLPIELEWEYACLGDISGRNKLPFSKAIAKREGGEQINEGEANLLFSGGEYSNSGIKKIDFYRENEFKIAQMHGNIWELISDIENRRANERGDYFEFRIAKGGCCKTFSIEAKAHRRLMIMSDARADESANLIGFRLVKSLISNA